MTEPRPSYDPRQLDLVNGVLTDELEALRSRVLIRLAKEFNIFDAPDTLRNIKKLAEPDIILAALQDYTNRKFPVITLCGSIRKVPRKIWVEKEEELVHDGWVTMSVVFWTMEDWKKLHDVIDKKQQRRKKDLDEMHKQKILMSSAIYVLNYEGYIGSSTRSEIEYAKSLGKVVMYLEPVE